MRKKARWGVFENRISYVWIEKISWEELKVLSKFPPVNLVCFCDTQKKAEASAFNRLKNLKAVIQQSHVHLLDGIKKRRRKKKK